MNPTLPAVVTIGNFDGFHRGHQHLVSQVVSRARTLGLQATAVTFDPHPRELFRPDEPLLRLTSTHEKVQLLRMAGVQDVWVCSFTPEIARLEPAEFLSLLATRWPIAELWVGSDFALGRGRSGKLDVLTGIGAVSGWRLQVVPPLIVDGQVVSSSRIRALIERGEHTAAEVLLGRSAAPILAR
jgi:riboflavin kinase / FMN adenylyltransferase